MKGLRGGQRWAYDLLVGEYRGSPMDYVMAIAIVFAMMGVVIARVLHEFVLPDAMVSFAVPWIKLIQSVMLQ